MTILFFDNQLASFLYIRLDVGDSLIFHIVEHDGWSIVWFDGGEAYVVHLECQAAAIHKGAVAERYVLVATIRFRTELESSAHPNLPSQGYKCHRAGCQTYSL